MDFTIRKARLEERPALEQLIALSARALSREDYSDAQIEGAVARIFGVDTELVADGTYLVVEHAGQPIACGGWSKRRTLFGGDRFAGREAGLLDPASEAAKIRAFFVHPDWARRGVGRALLAACEAEARAAGFRTLELMATLPGIKLYRTCGYLPGEQIEYELDGGLSIPFVPMYKTLPEE
ncbi:MAG: GNAT family N-acetyltransferase [Roseiflexaceae bacterium]